MPLRRLGGGRRAWGGAENRRPVAARRAHPQVESLETRVLLSVGLRQYPVPNAPGSPNAVAVGADNNVWLAYTGTSSLGVFNPVTQAFQQVPTSSSFDGTSSMVTGPDGNIWFISDNFSGPSSIDTVNVHSHQFQSFQVNAGQPQSVTAGPDGELWFVGNNSFAYGFVGKITTSGVITYYNLAANEYNPVAITAGPDGNLWIADDATGDIITMSTAGNVLSDIPGPAGAVVQQITAGPDGNIWLAMDAELGVVTLPQKTITTYTLNNTTDSLTAICPGPDGNVWFSGSYTTNGSSALNTLFGVIDVTSKAISTYTIPSTGDAWITGITPGAADDLWMSDSADLIAEVLPTSAPQAYKIVVNTTGDQASPSGASDPNLSLREAIEVANGTLKFSALSPQELAQVSLASGSADQIDFAIPQGDAGFNPSSGVWTIAPASALPNIVAAVFINGYSQAGARPNSNAPGQPDNAVLRIALNGSAAGGAADGLVIQGAGSTVEGLAVGGFQTASGQLNVGIVATAANVLVAGNFLGTNAAGTAAVPNSVGVAMGPGAGITIGGTTPAARNVISGNLDAGVDIEGTSGAVSGGVLIEGNDIGTDVTGAHALPNNTAAPGSDFSFGVGVAAITISSSSNNTIGGTVPGAGNVIAGNGSIGILLENNGTAQTAANVIAGNLIGVDASGANALGNAGPGIGLASVSLLGLDSVTGTTIGGTTAAARNVISGNAINNVTYSPENANVVLVGDLVEGNLVEGNLIGTDAAGNAAPAGSLPAAIDGVRIDSPPVSITIVPTGGSSNNTVGGNAAGSGNVIAFNSGVGVHVVAGTGDPILGNSIYGNGQLGIDLVGGTEDAFGVTANAPGGPHSGPNDLQNFPVLNGPTTNAGQTTITGTLNSTPNQAFTIEIYATPTADPSGHGQGQLLVGRLTNVTTDAAGNSPQFTFTANGNLSGQAITATATDSSGNTSEFALDVTEAAITPGPPSAPVLSAQSDTGASSSDGLTKNNGSAAAPLMFTVSGVNPPDGLVQFYNDTNPGSPVPLGSPVQAVNGTATITLGGGANLPLADGPYQFAATASINSGGTPSALSSPSATVRIQTSLEVVSVNASGMFYNGSTVPLPDHGQIIVRFNHALAGLSPEDPGATGFKGNPFAVMLIPSGPDGLTTKQQVGVYWSAPAGIDSGDLPVPATAAYVENADGTATITVTPHEPLTTNIYLISVNNLSDLAGNPLENAAGAPGNYYTSFDYRPPAVTPAAPAVTLVSANHGAVTIHDNSIPQPDTIGITFNKAMDPFTINSNTIELLGRPLSGGSYQVEASAVAYSPSTQTAYLTPETTLTPNMLYLVEVSAGATDDTLFPNNGTPLAQPFFTTFTVSSGPVGPGSPPFTILGTNPGDITVVAQPLGYATVTFSEPLSFTPLTLSRFAAMLVPQTGGVTTGNSGYSDVPYNAKLAFNPSTNTLVIVPTGQLTNNVLNVFALAQTPIQATDGDPLNDSAHNPPGYRNFKLAYGASPAIETASRDTAIVVSAAASPPVSVTQVHCDVAAPRYEGFRLRSIRPLQKPTASPERHPGRPVDPS